MMQDRSESEDGTVLAFDTTGETKDATSFAVRRLAVYCNFYRNRLIASNICRLSLALCGFN
jgi:hypothetical protein